MANSTKRKHLLDAYRFAGFRPAEIVCGVFGDSLARIVRNRPADDTFKPRDEAGTVNAFLTERSRERFGTGSKARL